MKNKIARQIAVRAGLVLFGGMLLYAVFQYLSGEAAPVELLFRHLWHSIVLGGLIYFSLLIWLKPILLGPLHQMIAHAHRLAYGAFDRWNYTKAHNELDQVTGMMNRIADHLNSLKQTSWRKHVETIEQHLDSLRSRDDLPLQVHGDLVDIRDCLRKMDLAVAGLAESLSDPESRW